MYATVISFIPSLICLFWLILNPLISRGSKSFWQIEILLFLTGTATFAEAFVKSSIGINDNAALAFFLIGQFSAPMVIPLGINYLKSIKAGKDKKQISMAWISIPFSLLFAELILLLLSGPDSFAELIGKILNGTRYPMLDDKVEQLSYICCVWAAKAIIAIEYILIICGTVFSHIRKTAGIQNYNIAILFTLYVILHIISAYGLQHSVTASLLTVLISIFIFIISYTGLFDQKETVTVRELLNGIRLDAGESLPEEEEEENTVQEEEEKPNLIERLHQTSTLQSDAATENDDDNDDDYMDFEDEPSGNPMTAEFEDSLRIRFEDLVVSEQLFLQKGLKISDIATRLNTNRTYISRLVNNTYNMSFSDYINTLRIDYAEQYLIHNKGAKQTDIAAACGFPNASSFNNIFKKITGVTPKIWLATRS